MCDFDLFLGTKNKNKIIKNQIRLIIMDHSCRGIDGMEGCILYKAI